MIRPATLDDTDSLVRMAQHFAATPEYAGSLRLDPDTVASLIGTLLENPQALLLVAEQEPGQLIGMMVVICFPHMLSGEWMASEIAWWMEPSYRGEGVQMYHYAERWARQQGARALQMVAPNPRVERFYAQLGLTKIETAYQKRLD